MIIFSLDMAFLQWRSLSLCSSKILNVIYIQLETETVISTCIPTPAAHFMTRDLELWPFDLKVNTRRATAIRCMMSTKFCVDNSSRFSFRARIHINTQVTDATVTVPMHRLPWVVLCVLLLLTGHRFGILWWLKCDNVTLKRPLKDSLARDVIHTARAYATMSVSVCLSVCLWRLCIVVTGCNASRISLHAWIDGCLCYLLTTPHPDRRMGCCRDFWWKWGVWKNW